MSLRELLDRAMAAQKLTNDKIFQMRVSKELIALLDDWRRAQPKIPSRSEAIRRMIERCVRADMKATKDRATDPA